MNCKICNLKTKNIFTAKILNKYHVKYYYCNHCGFLQTEEAYWIEEAYEESINVSDTGIMQRNIHLSKISCLLIYFLFDKSKKFVDFAGGYGIFTRLMRDMGFDFYWQDKFSVNLVARGFEYDQDNTKDAVELLTSFEAFEHFDQPIAEIENMLKISRSILFSTNLLPDDPPQPDDWWYYGLEHGQHISFYSKTTLKYIAKKYNLNLYTNNFNLHLLTDKKINRLYFKLILISNWFGLSYLIEKTLNSKTVDDMNQFKNNES